ncbi:hypothetical protein [Denitromonas iodatirespirans]|uniref:Uncharacterized protein n=1 Tax=Denitromonas iodatirespirans TaxID=2795389 RepID=A0A944HCI4_DENI1|nr:hypothetical protein [Denitromonas iodatirespirans]MBT0962752.1 hypothetical protein [Denitromonas iodatirespirans]
MSGFENYREDTAALEREIEVRGIVLGIDWHNTAEVMALAREALASSPAHVEALVRDPDPKLKAKGELFALAVLMLQTMAESASIGIHSHGGSAWKALGHAFLVLTDAARRDASAPSAD